MHSKSKQRSARNRAYSGDNKRRNIHHPILNIHTQSDLTPNGYTSTLSPAAGTKFHVINENSDADIDQKNFVNSLSAANLSKFNHNGVNASASETSTPSPHSQSPNNNNYPLSKQISIPAYLTSPRSPGGTPGSGRSGTGYNGGPYSYNIITQTPGSKHYKSTTNSSITSAFSNISDQSFVEDFHSITAELENIDNLVRNQVQTPSMASLFSDKELVSSPQHDSTSPNGINGTKDKVPQLMFKDNKDVSSYSESDSKETGKTMQFR